MNADEKLKQICCAQMTVKGLDCQARLDEELKEIAAQNEAEYFLDLYERQVKYPMNPNNLLVGYLLDIVETVDLNTPPEYIQGEYPDIDIDYLAPVRDYIRVTWAPQQFGQENVCGIGSYSTFGLKSSFLDMARIHSLDTKELNVLTKQLEMKDEDGKLLTFDKALEEYPDLNEYCLQHPEVARTVKNIVNRNRGTGTHAGGLVIASRRIDDFVPLIRGKEGMIVSAWTEGLHSQDLGPMGLIKFDLLSITDLMRIAIAVKLVKERHGVDYICSDPAVNRDWSDTSYLNDPLAIHMANEADLLGIFQFDSPGIRNLAKGNVTSFDDLVAMTALYRPGPLNCLSRGTRVSVSVGYKPIETLDPEHDSIQYVDSSGKLQNTQNYILTKTGNKKMLRIKTKSGKEILSSLDHPFFTKEGYKKAEDLKVGENLAIKN